jgi:hypothetical protein
VGKSPACAGMSTLKTTPLHTTSQGSRTGIRKIISISLLG